MTLMLKGQIAVVTGAASGMGAATARLLTAVRRSFWFRVRTT